MRIDFSRGPHVARPPTRWNGAANVGDVSARANLYPPVPLTLRQSSIFSGETPGWTRRLFIPREESTPARPPLPRDEDTRPADALPDSIIVGAKSASKSMRSVEFDLEDDVDEDTQVRRKPVSGILKRYW